MSIIPKDKSDLDAIRSLDELTNSELQPFLSDLLEWVQDINWPVAAPIAKRLTICGDELVEPLRSILVSDDAVWKYWVLSSIILESSVSVREKLKDEIEQLAMSPTEIEKNEGVDFAARKIMNLGGRGI